MGRNFLMLVLLLVLKIEVLKMSFHIGENTTLSKALSIIRILIMVSSLHNSLKKANISSGPEDYQFIREWRPLVIILYDNMVKYQCIYILYTYDNTPMFRFS